MTEEKHNFPTRHFECPEDLFGPAKYIVRKLRMKARISRKIRDAESDQEVFGLLAQYIVEWNLDDCETGDPLAQPYQNADVFDELDILEQFPWIIEKLFSGPPPSRRKR